MRIIKGNWFILIILIVLGTNITILSSGNSALSFTTDSRYNYAVSCTDYCGSRVWDATNLDADLFFIITSISELDDVVSIYTRYNSTSLANHDNPDYGIYTLNESYSYLSRESKTMNGKYSWHWSTLEPTFNISVPSFFLAHAHTSFENNSFLLQRNSKLIDIEISSQYTFQTYQYSGKWIQSYIVGSSNFIDEATLTASYDLETGILLRMEIDMISTQIPIGPLSLEINVDAVGSFKITLLLPSNQTTDAFALIVGILSLISIILFLNKRDSRFNKDHLIYEGKDIIRIFDKSVCHYDRCLQE